jgi:hypothetical protein
MLLLLLLLLQQLRRQLHVLRRQQVLLLALLHCSVGRRCIWRPMLVEQRLQCMHSHYIADRSQVKAGGAVAPVRQPRQWCWHQVVPDWR